MRYVGYTGEWQGSACMGMAELAAIETELREAKVV